MVVLLVVMWGIVVKITITKIVLQKDVRKLEAVQIKKKHKQLLLIRKFIKLSDQIIFMVLPYKMSLFFSAISSDNKGFRMLSKLGWNKGEALGKTQESGGLLEPV